MLQFWLLRRAFGWEAAGYQAWDLGLHVVASVLAGAFVVQVGRLSASLGRPLPHRPLATLVTLIFVAHPLAEEVVPAVARNIDLLLGVGFFGALTLLAALSRRRATGHASAALEVGYLATVALALGAKESAVLLAPAAALFVAVFRFDLAPRARAREALRLSLLPGVLVAVYLLVRGRVLGGMGGYYNAGNMGAYDWVLGAFERGLIEPFAPSISTLLKPHRDAWTYVPVGVLWAAAVGGMVRSPHRRLALYAGAWMIVFVWMFGATGTFTRRVLYVPTLASALLVAIPLLHALERRSWVGLGLGGVWVATFVHGTPALWRYPDWGEASTASEVYRTSTAWDDLPVGSTIWLVDRPYRVDIDPRRFRLWGGSHLGLAHGAISYSVEAWLRDVRPAQRLRIRPVTHWFLSVPVAEQVVEPRLEDGALVVHHVGGLRTIQGGTPFPAEVRGEEVWIRARDGEHPNDRLAVWSPTGLWMWEPGTDVLSAPR